MGIADELITRGWTQGRLLDPVDKSVCLVGATRCEQMDALIRAMQACGIDVDTDTGYGIASWNDAPGRTYDEVLRVAKLADEILDGLR